MRCPIRIVCAELLSDVGRRSDRETESHDEGEREDLHADPIGRVRRRAIEGNDPEKENEAELNGALFEPGRVADLEELSETIGGK